MKNQEIADLFYKIADILEIKDVQWEPRAYRMAARVLETMSEDIDDYIKEGKDLKDIEGIGKSMEKSILEYVKTRKMKKYEQLKKQIPKELTEMLKIPGVGPKKVKELYKKGIKSIKQLEKAARKGRIKGISTFKEKTQENILKGIEFLKTTKGRTLLGIALPVAEEIKERLEKVPGVIRVNLAGSVRRGADTIGDIDILVSGNAKVIDYFTKMPEVTRVLSKGATKSSVVINNKLQVDLRLISKESYGAALMYFIGNKQSNIEQRRIAIKKGIKLSEYGLFKGKKKIAGKTEEEVFKKLGLRYIEPELRENHGEFEAARKGKLPSLIKLSDIKGDLHVHTNWTDGVNTPKEMIAAAKAKKYEYIALTDHSKSTSIAGGLSEKQCLKRLKDIKKLKSSGIKVFVGMEVDILKDGSLDYSDDVLKKLDVVIGSVHSRFKMSKSEMTNRIMKAMENKHVNIIGHPTGRLINVREPYQLDFSKLFRKAKETGTALEINASMNRLDLKDIYIQEAIKYGVRLSINTDAHSVDQFNQMKLGVLQARRGWAEKKDIINTYTLDKIKKFLS